MLRKKIFNFIDEEINSKFIVTEKHQIIMNTWLQQEKENPKESRFIPGFGRTNDRDDNRPIWPFSAVLSSAKKK